MPHGISPLSSDERCGVSARQRCRLRYLIALHQRAVDNRVRVRLKGQHFLPAVDNHEAEIQCGLAIRRYCKCALAVRIDRVRPCDWFLSERENRAVLATRDVSVYDSISRSVDT